MDCCRSVTGLLVAVLASVPAAVNWHQTIDPVQNAISTCRGQDSSCRSLLW